MADDAAVRAATERVHALIGAGFEGGSGICTALARIAVEAARPIIAAETLRTAADDAQAFEPDVAEWLNRTAGHLCAAVRTGPDDA